MSRTIGIIICCMFGIVLLWVLSVPKREVKSDSLPSSRVTQSEMAIEPQEINQEFRPRPSYKDPELERQFKAEGLSHSERQFYLEMAEVIRNSDDYEAYKFRFLQATAALIKGGSCTLLDFKEYGGWVRSGTHKGKGLYFVYCGKTHVSNRIYLRVRDGKISFRNPP